VKVEKVVGGKTKEGEMKKVARLEHKQTNLRMFLTYITPKVREFVLHNHVAQWQDSQYKSCLNKLKEVEIMSLIDFAKKNSFKGQNEVHEEHRFILN
jgi:hypothetical protein